MTEIMSMNSESLQKFAYALEEKIKILRKKLKEMKTF